MQIRAVKTIDQRAADRIIQQGRDAVRKAENELTEDLPKLKTGDGKPPKMVVPGQTVSVVSLGKNATVLSKPDKNGEVQVQVGIIKLSVRLDDIRLSNEKPKRRQMSRLNITLQTLSDWSWIFAVCSLTRQSL